MQPMVHDSRWGEFGAAASQVRDLSDIDLPVVDRHCSAICGDRGVELIGRLSAGADLHVRGQRAGGSGTQRGGADR